MCLGSLGIGPGHQHAPVGDVGQRVPHLLSGDHPLVPVADGPGGQAGQIGPGSRLAEQLAPRLLAGEGPAQDPVAELVGSVGDHGRAGHGQPEELASTGGRGPGLGQAAVDVPLQVGRSSRPPHPSGNETQASPRSNWRERNASTGVVLRVELVEQLAGPVGHHGRVVCHAQNIQRRTNPVVQSVPRSGTTWTLGALQRDRSLCSLKEPDSEADRASAIWAKRKTGRFPVLAPGDRNDAYRMLWAWILEGATETPRLRVGAQILRAVSPPAWGKASRLRSLPTRERRRYLRGGFSPAMWLAGTIASRPPVHRNPDLDGRRLLVKTVHAPLAMDWLGTEFEMDVLVLLRHPGSPLDRPRIAQFVHRYRRGRFRGGRRRSQGWRRSMVQPESVGV